jgi:outer membrane usher protein FimD/PapC
VRGALCFVHAEFGLFASPFTIDGVWVGWPGGTEQRLKPFEIDDLPLDTDIAVSDIQVTPGRRQAVAARFTVALLQHVTARLWQVRDGMPVPAGAMIALEDEGEIFPVGYDGLVFLPLESGRAFTLTASWPGGHCRANILSPESEQPIVDAGNVPCRE